MLDSVASLPSGVTAPRILTWPDQRLTQPSLPLPVEDPEVLRKLGMLVMGMRAAMTEARGIGLAAIQIGVPVRVFIAHVPHERREPMVFVNPVIRERRGELTHAAEGCLSLPGEIELVERHQRVVVSRLTERGVAVTDEFSGITARVIQHEFEHLEGMTMLDHLLPARRHDVERRLQRKAEKREQRARWRRNSKARAQCTTG